MFVKKFQNTLIILEQNVKIIFPMDTLCLLLRAINCLIAVVSDSGLLIALAILNDSAHIAE